LNVYEAFYEIVDVTGRIIMSGNFGKLNNGINQIQLNIQELASGTYHFSIMTDENRYQLPFIKF
jgi:hypothetical protein